jgi:hypothetical protein
MPFYHYVCRDCLEFARWLPMRESGSRPPAQVGPPALTLESLDLTQTKGHGGGEGPPERMPMPCGGHHAASGAAPFRLDKLRGVRA